MLEAYQTGAESAGANCKVLYISRLKFDVNLSDGYKTGQTMLLGRDLFESQELIQWADHVVMAYPNWWSFMPAIERWRLNCPSIPLRRQMNTDNFLSKYENLQ